MQQDLAFVKSALTRSRAQVTSLAINVMWGLIILVGFGLNDFLPRMTGWFWLVAVPVGVALSIVFAVRAARRKGHVDPDVGTRAMLHWGGLCAGLAILTLLALTGTIRFRGSGSSGLSALVMVGLSYYLAGVHLDRSFLWPGVVMGLGAVTSIFVRQHLGTMIGVAVCVALIAGALIRIRRDGRQPEQS
jgi:hypothetical protein